jgi:hypothetical protein
MGVHDESLEIVDEAVISIGQNWLKIASLLFSNAFSLTGYPQIQIFKLSMDCFGVGDRN